MTAIAPSPSSVPLPQTPLLAIPSFASPSPSSPPNSPSPPKPRPTIPLPMIPSSPLRQSTLPPLPELGVPAPEVTEIPALKAKGRPIGGVPSTLTIPDHPLPPPMSIMSAGGGGNGGGVKIGVGSLGLSHGGPGGLGGMGEFGLGFSLTPRHAPPPASLIRFPPAPPPTVELDADPSLLGPGDGRGGGGAGAGIWSMPNSLRDLQSLSRSVNQSLLKPVKIKLAPASLASPASPVSPVGAGEGGKREMMDIGLGGTFERRLKEIEIELKGQRSYPSSSPSRSISVRSRPFDDKTAARDDESTLKATHLSQNDGNEMVGRIRRRRSRGGEVGGAIDEVDVEWCFFCGEEGKREKGGMELKKVGEGDGWQWVCAGCAKKS
ncbi:hypothetical protein IAR50_004884 [Cryptococcus sp. DSM 104548]